MVLGTFGVGLPVGAGKKRVHHKDLLDIKILRGKCGQTECKWVACVWICWLSYYAFCFE